MPSWLERLRDALAPGIAVEREIGSGGMGHVALGRDTVLDRWLAIKVLQPEKASALNAARFVREARNAAGIKHPNVVEVHRWGEAGGLYYYTMDYVEGESLARRLERGRLTQPEAIQVGLDLLAALGVTHARNLIHRDVKPANIFLTGDRALLGDFGIAYDLDSTQTELTRPGDLIGTPLYMPAEQLNGGAPITPQADLFSAGVVLYEALAGRGWMPPADPDRLDWTRVPEPLRGPIRRALQVDPRLRWPSAATFAEALSRPADGPSAPEPPRRRSNAGTALVMSVVAVVGAALLEPRGPADSRDRDLVIPPFGTAGLADSTVGARLSGLTGWSFERLTDLRLAPRQRASRLWYGSSLPPVPRLDAVTEATGSRYGAWGTVRPRGPILEVQLRIVNDGGKLLLQHSVFGDSADLPAMGDSVALTITRELFADRLAHKAGALTPTSVAAQTQFLMGEDAFARDAYLTAERHYGSALRLDSSFVLAAWRLGNTRRWMPLRADPAFAPGFRRLFEANREALPEVDRLLIEAQFLPSGSPRFDRFERALVAAGDDPYAALLYGDELFHRGPLAGRPLEDAVAMLERAVAMDSTLAPAWEHLAWALIRLGDRKRAGQALARLERLAGRPDESEIPLPMFLRIAHDLRFGSASGASGPAALLEDPGRLALAARGAMSFDLPEAQAALGAALARAGETRDARASGLTARGVALVALGRPREALEAFDSAAVLFSRPGEARLQAAEWRVIPAALGMPGVEDRERDRGRVALATWLTDSLLAPRAAWALALDASTRGDTATAEGWADQVRRSRGPDGPRLAPLLDGLTHAARGQWEAALAASAPALAYDSVGHAPDPFHRAALHLLRGHWLAQLGRPEDADRAWRWYENLDVRAWPAAEAQPAEVDWALSTYARWSRARLALDTGRDAAACALGRRVEEIWAAVEPTLAVATRDLRRLERRCPS